MIGGIWRGCFRRVFSNVLFRGMFAEVFQKGILEEEEEEGRMKEGGTSLEI